jgi:predicted nucleotide-binding protein
MSNEFQNIPEKIRTAHDDAKQLLDAGALTRNERLRWILRIQRCVFLLYGPESIVAGELKDLLQAERASESPTGGFFAKFQAVGSLVEFLESIAQGFDSIPFSLPSRPPATRDVFVIHGRDELNSRRLADMLRDTFKLNPIVIRLHAGGGRMMLDKFEGEANHCPFAFGLFTPDDAVTNSDGEQYKQVPS